jgi:hypothetical protein
MWNVEPHYAKIRESKVATFTDVRIGYFRAVAPLSEMRCLGGSIALQNVRRLLRDCDDGRVGVAANDGRHHRRIDDPQIFGAENPEIRVDNAADRAGARRMIIRACPLLDKGHDSASASDAGMEKGARSDFVRAGCLKISIASPNAGNHCCTIMPGRQIVVRDARLRVRARRPQRHSATAGRLQQGCRYGEGMIEGCRQPFIEVHHGRHFELAVRHALIAAR